MLKERVFHNVMLTGMAKSLRVPLEQEPGIYILYKNKQEQIHRKEYFRGDPDETYKKLLEIDEYRRLKNGRKH